MQSTNTQLTEPRPLKPLTVAELTALREKVHALALERDANAKPAESFMIAIGKEPTVPLESIDFANMRTDEIWKTLCFERGWKTLNAGRYTKNKSMPLVAMHLASLYGRSTRGFETYVGIAESLLALGRKERQWAIDALLYDWIINHPEYPVAGHPSAIGKSLRISRERVGQRMCRLTGYRPRSLPFYVERTIKRRASQRKTTDYLNRLAAAAEVVIARSDKDLAILTFFGRIPSCGVERSILGVQLGGALKRRGLVTQEQWDAINKWPVKMKERFGLCQTNS